MTTLAPDTTHEVMAIAAELPDRLWRRAMASGRVAAGGGVLGLILLLCLPTLYWTTNPDSRFYYDQQNADAALKSPAARPLDRLFGTDALGRGLLGRCLLGGVISLGIGIGSAAISVALGVGVGLLAGYRGGWTDALLMRSVDVLYGLPYILLVILFKIALESPLVKVAEHLQWGQTHWFSATMAANLVVLFLAIGLVSWLTMARVVRGQVLSLRAQPFIEACKATGLREWRIFTRHLLPNLVGPVTVYATLTVPVAILEESFLSFLGIGIQAPLPTWGSLASEGLSKALNPINSRWWLLVIPCIFLAVTLLALNFVGDGLRDVFDPKREVAKV
ncbi:MAG TPA: ABC transporter permease [Tepidisphaeraceae bacterium]|jgi:oligopeptide transport system permease protein|nr:ABC transporter permease [Tepidisphaeraceae bacterium]